MAKLTKSKLLDILDNVLDKTERGEKNTAYCKKARRQFESIFNNLASLYNKIDSSNTPIF